MLAPFVEDAFFFPLYNFSFFVKNQVFIGVWINIQVFNLIPLVNISVFMPTPSSFDYSSSIIELNAKDSNASRVPLLYRIVLAILGFLIFHMKLIIVLSSSVKNCFEILRGDFTESIDCFWYDCLLLCWSYLSKSMGDLSIFWYLLYFLSSKT